jgi:hypothetical protein
LKWQGPQHQLTAAQTAVEGENHKKDWSKYSRKQIATKPAPTKMTEAELGPLLGQLLYDPIDERVVSQDRGLITDVELVQTKPETGEGPNIPISKQAKAQYANL